MGGESVSGGEGVFVDESAEPVDSVRPAGEWVDLSRRTSPSRLEGGRLLERVVSVTSGEWRYTPSGSGFCGWVPSGRRGDPGWAFGGEQFRTRRLAPTSYGELRA
jgi:hypothetical protein